MQIGFDELTGHPFVQVDGEDCLGLLPLTRLQVERAVWSDGLHELDEPRERQLLLGRLNDPGDDEVFDFEPGDDWQELYRRRPVLESPERPAFGAPRKRHVARRPPPLIATNIAFRPFPETGRDASTSCPERGTHLDHVLRWLTGGEHQLLPTRAHYEAADRLQVSSAAIIQALLKAAPPELDRVLASALEQLVDDLPEGHQGLVYRPQGCWELTGETALTTVWSEQRNSVETVHRPLAVGQSPALPDFIQEDFARTVLMPRHPCVGCRPMLPLDALVAVRDYSI